MKKFLVIMCLVLVAIFLISCGNKDMWDTVYTYDSAIVDLGDGTVVEGKIENWTDYENSDQIQVKINGKTYLTHIENVILIAE